MLSYRHSFHAGNHADVLKHIVLSFTLRYMTQKDKAFRYVETHAGAGAYSLRAAHAQKTQEYTGGIGALYALKNTPKAVKEYLHAVRDFNQENGTHELHYYPGSPWFAQTLSRDQDKLMLHELHPNDFSALTTLMQGDKRVKVIPSDGFEGVVSYLPPPEKRLVCLIDPSYELKNDYNLIITHLQQYHTRFAQGTYLIWYPVVQRELILGIEKKLKKTAIRNVQRFELCVEQDNTDYGMTGSGMLVVNPPWTLMEAMQQTLPWLCDKLATGTTAHYKAEQLIAE